MNTWKISCRGRNSPGRSAADRMYTVWGAARKAPCYCALTIYKQIRHIEVEYGIFLLNKTRRRDRNAVVETMVS